MNTSVRTILGFLEGAQTIIALYESPDGPTSTAFAFDTLSKLLNDPKLLRAQIELAAGHDTVMLMGSSGPVKVGEEPNGPVVVVSMRGH